MQQVFTQGKHLLGGAGSGRVPRRIRRAAFTQGKHLLEVLDFHRRRGIVPNVVTPA